ncbi:hypothetical protein [Roseomonas sp. BN140053]|uniref:hypothetical protein n=1 Tax=Roseomonas sp. BN140053 TaxID=3391898 RepID=UPI0039E9554F
MNSAERYRALAARARATARSPDLQQARRSAYERLAESFDRLECRARDLAIAEQELMAILAGLDRALLADAAARQDTCASPTRRVGP